MGRRSTKNDKSILQLAREQAGLTRKAVEDLNLGISEDRLEKIEGGKSEVHPEEVLLLSQAYHDPALKNQYCLLECPLGSGRALPTEEKPLAQITLEILDEIQTLSRQRDRMVEIAVDGQISSSEMTDFLSIRQSLRQMSETIESLNLWIDNRIASGELNPDFQNDSNTKS